jgi:DNA-binding response OmpR family regulator
MGWVGAVVLVGPESPEAAVVREWTSQNAVTATRIPLSQGLDASAALECALIVLDALDDPPLAIAECARLRAVSATKPLLFLSPQGRSLEQAALRAGTTAFLERPVAADRLHSYVGRFFPRSPSSAPPSPLDSIDLGDGVRLDIAGVALIADGCAHALTPDCFRLLEYLINNAGRAITSAELVRKGVLLVTQAARYRAMMFELRRRLGPARERISLVRGFGYRFDFPQAPKLTRDNVVDDSPSHQ